MSDKSFNERVSDAEASRKAAAETLGEFLKEAGYQKTGEKLLSGEVVDIHEIAVRIRNTEDKGLRMAMHKCIERYAEARSEKIEYKVKSDILDDFKRELQYQDIEF
jgi:hypothetical protein